ncbi:MAG: DUF3820 family protein [Arcobacteraceae bacterium]
MWFVSYIFFGFMFASWIEPYFPKAWLKMYPDLHNYVSFILVTSVLFYVYFLRPMLKEMNGTKRIGFGKYKGRKWEDLPTDYLKWVAETHDDFNEASALRELRKRKKQTVKQPTQKYHLYESTVLGIIESKRKCWKCNKNTPIIALKFYSNMNDHDEYSITPKVEIFIEYIHESILTMIQSIYPFFQYRYSKTAQATYLANSCIHCNALQGDWQLHQEPDGAFFNSGKLQCNQYIVLDKGNLSYSKNPKK